MAAKTKTKTQTSSARARVEGWLGKEAGGALYTYLKSAHRKNKSRLFPDLDKQIRALHPPLFLSPPPKVKGSYFDVTKVDRFLRFGRQLRHIKGTGWSGRPFEPDLWQILFVFGPVLGWMNEEGYRLVRTSYQEVPKKNGKSTSGAVLSLFMLMADGEPGAEVGSAAGDREQARAVFDVAQYMAKASPPIKKRVRVGRSQLTYEATASWYKVFSADGDLKEGLNLHFASIDELLVQKNRKLVDNLENSTGSRTQPLIAFFTTAGLDAPGTIYNEKRTYAEKVAKGDLVDPSWWVVIYTIKDAKKWKDEKSWAQANPGLGKSLRIEYLRAKAAQAAASPAALNTFLRNHLNIRTGQITRWTPIEIFDRSGAKWLTGKESDYYGRPAYGGLDLASTTDLAALVLSVPDLIKDPETGEEVTILRPIVRAWTPEATLAQRAERDQAPYEQWVEQGFLIATPGDVIDYDAIENEAFSLADKFDIQRLHFDRWGSKQITQHLQDGGLELFEMGQGFASMSPAMKEFERLLYLSHLAHGGHPLLRWAMQSLAVISDANGNIKPDRDKSTGKIDPFVAWVMSIDAWSRQPEQTASAYEDRGLSIA